MANILYGVNGEGSGHSSRAGEVITHLEAQGHRVHVASFDRGYRIAKTGCGAYWEDLNNERIESFLFNGESYREKLAEYPRADNSALFAKLDELIAGAMS